MYETSYCYVIFSPYKTSSPQGEGDETAMLLYTSGATSGSPRGVTLSHSILGRQVCTYIVCKNIIPKRGYPLKNINPKKGYPLPFISRSPDREGGGRMGLEPGGQCSPLRRSWLHLRPHQLTTGPSTYHPYFILDHPLFEELFAKSTFPNQAPLTMGARVTLMPQFDPLKV